MVWPAAIPAQPMNTRRAIKLSFILAKEPHAQPPLHLTQAAELLTTGVFHQGNLIERKVMKSVWRKHLIICLVLGLLAIPVYFLDRELHKPSCGHWIPL